MEVMGQENNKLYGTIHYRNPQSEKHGTYTLENGNFTDEYHTFACDWEPGKITWYVDGVKYHEANDWYSTTEGQGTVAYPAPATPILKRMMRSRSRRTFNTAEKIRNISGVWLFPTARR